MLHKNKSKQLLYMRTDLGTHDLKAGGSVSHTLGVIDGFLHHKFSIVCASSAMVSLLKKKQSITVKKLYIPSIFSLLGFKLNCLLSNFFFTLQVLSLFKRNTFSFVYQRYSMLNCTGVLLKKIKKVPLILEYNGSEVWADKHWAPKRKLRLTFFIAWIENINIKNADHIVVVSQVLKDELIMRGINKEKILVNPNGVDVQRFNPAQLTNIRMQKRKERDLSDAFVFGFIGSFSFWHGIHILEEIIPVMSKQYKQAHFLLIGDGPLQKVLKKTLRENKVDSASYTFTGMVNANTAHEFLSLCDAFLLPTQPNPDGSRFFGSPTKLFEYMSLAKPIIASDIEQVKKILSPAIALHYKPNFITNELGILVEPDDSSGFIKACIYLMKQNKKQQRMLGYNARNKVIEQFTWHQHVENIMNIINI